MLTIMDSPPIEWLKVSCSIRPKLPQHPICTIVYATSLNLLFKYSNRCGSRSITDDTSHAPSGPRSSNGHTATNPSTDNVLTITQTTTMISGSTSLTRRISAIIATKNQTIKPKTNGRIYKLKIFNQLSSVRSTLSFIKRRKFPNSASVMPIATPKKDRKFGSSAESVGRNDALEVRKELKAHPNPNSEKMELQHSHRLGGRERDATQDYPKSGSKHGKPERGVGTIRLIEHTDNTGSAIC